MKDIKSYALLKEYFESWIYDHSFSFYSRLMRENRWDNKFAKKAIDEYIKFIYLISISKNPLTPSDEVDQVWHLHLQYSEKYLEMCHLINKQVFHGPTKGGKEEKDKFENWYEKTKEFYELEFKSAPPQDIWPSSFIRFSISPKSVRLNSHHYFFINKNYFYFLLILSLIGGFCVKVSFFNF